MSKLYDNQIFSFHYFKKKKKNFSYKTVTNKEKNAVTIGMKKKIEIAELKKFALK